MNQSRRLPSLPLWSHWNQERLIREEATNPRSFARGFQMRAFTDDERKFPSFVGCYTPGIVVGDITRRGWPVYVGVDLASDKRPGNVIFVLAVDPSSQRRYPLEILCGAWTSPDTARQMAGVCSRHPNVRHIMVENNAYQQSIIDWIRNNKQDYSFWHKIESFTTGAKNKADPNYGLPGLEVEFKNKAWVIPSSEFESHHLTCRCGWCTWVAETKDYPMVGTFDTVMAMWFAREAVYRWPPSASGGALGLGTDFNAR